MKKKVKTYLTFSLDVEGDQDILEWAKAQPNFSSAMRDVCRTHIHNEPTLADVLAEIREIADKVEVSNTE